MVSFPAIAPVAPELLLAIGSLVLLMIGAFRAEDATRVVTRWSVALLVLAALVMLFTPAYGPTFGGAFINDAFARYLKILTLIGSAVAIVMSGTYQREMRFDRFEYPVLIVIATLGMLMMISANDLIAVYLGLELQSLAIYVLAAINRDQLRSTEAGLKYFVLGALSSGMLLYGMSLVYGFTGTTLFPEIALRIQDAGFGIGLVFGLVFILAGVAFKVSAAPFHMWTPDVYEGAPTPITALIAGAPKVAAMALFVRIVVSAFGPALVSWQEIVIFISILSMVLGAFAAIGQRNIKRLMAYSSIGHMGYALVGLAAGSQQGVTGVIVYMSIYVPMTLGSFAIILSMRRSGEGMIETIDDLAGLGRRQPMTAFLFAMLLFSLAGIPPLGGFFAKFYVFLAAVQSGLIVLAVIGVLASAVGAFYYLRIVKLMYFDEPAPAFDPMPRELSAVLGLSGVFVIFFVLFMSPLVSAASAAALSLF